RGLAAGSASAGSARGDEFRARPAAEVLADRLAAALVHHEPGWRLPRHTALARRYNVSTAQIDAAIGELVSRHLIRRLPCRSRQSPWRRVPEDIGRALHIDPAEPVCVVRAVWATRVEPAAHATTYLPAEMAGPFMGGPPPSAAEAEGPAAAGPASTPATAAPADRTADAALSLQPLTSAP